MKVICYWSHKIWRRNKKKRKKKRKHKGNITHKQGEVRITDRGWRLFWGVCAWWCERGPTNRRRLSLRDASRFRTAARLRCELMFSWNFRIIVTSCIFFISPRSSIITSNFHRSFIDSPFYLFHSSKFRSRENINRAREPIVFHRIIS